jgi:Fur family transcriptional regulator, peroxide stress response regulator
METRMTNQKLKIMEHLKNTKTHPTAELVYRVVSKDLPAISLATVYRNLNLLAEQGKILKLEINGEYHYDGFCDSHQHLVCTNCDKIIDIGQKEISNYAMRKIKSSDFELRSVRIIFYGVCKNCKEN